MRTIQVSQAVWAAIAERGKFGESEDDVLRRVFHLPQAPGNGIASRHVGVQRRKPSANDGHSRRSIATTRLSSYISGNQLVLAFAGGPERRWTLPAREDKAKIRTVRNQAVDFAAENGATLGQKNAVKKALTDGGYHLTK